MPPGWVFLDDLGVMDYVAFFQCFPSLEGVNASTLYDQKRRYVKQIPVGISKEMPTVLHFAPSLPVSPSYLRQLQFNGLFYKRKTI